MKGERIVGRFIVLVSFHIENANGVVDITQRVFLMVIKASQSEARV